MGFFNKLFNNVKNTIKDLDESLERMHEERENEESENEERDYVKNNNSQNVVTSEIETIKCPNCQAQIKTNAYSQMLKCEYCGHEVVNEKFNQKIQKLGNGYKIYHYPVLVENNEEGPCVYDAQFDIYVNDCNSEEEALCKIAKEVSKALREFYEESEKTPIITEEKLISKRYVKKALEKGGRIEYVDVWVKKVDPNDYE